jgi:F-type H+-transporting ATPase subunit epsilon
MMRLEGLTPIEVWADEPEVSSIVAETRDGSFGILARRRDGVAALVPGVLIFVKPGAGEVFVAIDEGLLIKTGPRVVVAVRRAVRGPDLGALRELVSRRFLRQDAEATQLRVAVGQVEGSFMRCLASYERI